MIISASSPNAMSMVFSRPILSDTQPKNGRVRPLRIRSNDSAKVSAGSVKPSRVTGTLSIPKSLAIGASCATAINPPAATSTNITYMTQNTGRVRICIGVKSTRVCCIAGEVDGVDTFFRRALLRTCRGSVSNNEAIRTMMPWPRPKYRNAV